MINCALIGYGYWGPNIAKSLNRIKGVNLVVICDKDLGRQAEAKLSYPQAEITNDTDSLFDSTNLDAIIIATPASTHYQLAVRGLKAGKHILIEKPITTNTVEAKSLIELNKKVKKIVMVGHTFEYNPTVLTMKQIIKDDGLGKIYYIYSTRVNLGQIRGDVNALWNLAPHDISILNFLLDTQPFEVMAFGACYLQKGIEDVVFAVLRYQGNILVKIHVSWLDPAKERKMTIVGSKKMLVFDDLDNEMPLKIYDKRVDTGEVARGLATEYKIKLHSGDIYAPQIEKKEPLLEELNHFFGCIRNNKQPLTDLENGLRVVQVLEACQKSLVNKNKWIKI
ncbi:MAG: Oxidoreductase, NAD-binding domain protein [Candidatus Daviesbacteria bacterium GW2011_GWF2_38_6]|uniref:Oxidoreductase, NAD-binding domain protein n=1 Tax=Candidatus Daviesbacteria bacterium GW2011_GWF2_38_6 TaxID=1618432 RepID=A0A0G0NGX3_9BACT|nr:MAG: Oxidoreductase, NAD-binding domain protein [Candidatus Daviesbacteria bacterium GW2011_GWF2_38_6]